MNHMAVVHQQHFIIMFIVRNMISTYTCILGGPKNYTTSLYHIAATVQHKKDFTQVFVQLRGLATWWKSCDRFVH